MIRSILKVSMVSILALSTANCAMLGPVCSGKNAPLCLFIALAVAGVGIGLLGPEAIIYHHVVVSDERLKTDVQYVETLPNGVKIYAYRYKGDERVFYGAMAQELRKDKRFAHAVTRGKDGYYRVNYAKLGIKVAHGEMFAKAGEAAARRAS